MKSQRVRRSPEAARTEILRATEAALADTDFHALTVEEVMRRTGMTRSAFYHYFAGLDELALGLLEEVEHDIRAAVDAWLEGEDDDDPVQATQRHLGAMFRLVQTRRDLMYAVAQAAEGHPRVYREWQARVVDYFVDKTARFIRRQVAKGLSHVENPDALARALILMNNAVGNDHMARRAETDATELARVVAGVWNAAIYGRTR